MFSNSEVDARPSPILCKPPMWCKIETPHRRFTQYWGWSPVVNLIPVIFIFIRQYRHIVIFMLEGQIYIFVVCNIVNNTSVLAGKISFKLACQHTDTVRFNSVVLTKQFLGGDDFHFMPNKPIFRFIEGIHISVKHLFIKSDRQFGGTVFGFTGAVTKMYRIKQPPNKLEFKTCQKKPPFIIQTLFPESEAVQ